MEQQYIKTTITETTTVYQPKEGVTSKLGGNVQERVKDTLHPEHEEEEIAQGSTMQSLDDLQKSHDTLDNSPSTKLKEGVKKATDVIGQKAEEAKETFIEKGQEGAARTNAGAQNIEQVYHKLKGKVIGAVSSEFDPGKPSSTVALYANLIYS